ncbi:MAG: HNH endonuclease [Defluviitaleaceae bacterium]|nr:HNH endonuclease [Defluviitaleaceae bacterium]
MVHLNKSPLPPGVTINSAEDYRKGEVLCTLVSDCHGKCYICEDKPTTINIEHIVPHRNDPKLKFDWNNLFISCGHCNNTKLAKFDDIIDPTQCDPEMHIALSVEITDEIIERVHVQPLTTDTSTLSTAKLLNLVYNGGSTDIKEIECSNLRNSHLMPNIRLFYQYIRNYRDEPDEGYDNKIRKEIDRSSIFAAFKRKIVRDDPELFKIFADSLH